MLVTPTDLMVVGLLALGAFGVPGLLALAYLKWRASGRNTPAES
ncbi:hypothetical protein [Halomarina ordinaria]|uniref:Uncharacterized protein n=1 Tax=Halomarina ordinaria TaxID=3033939 RepID=A0ABD5U7H1_9EURY|nr:hypothetical protein [Halomarina sp. PSRA2]